MFTSLVFTALLSSLAILYLYKWHSVARRAKRQGAVLPRLYAHHDRIFGLDFFAAQGYAFATDSLLELYNAAFARYGPTYATRRFGGIAYIHTSEPENIRAVWTNRSSDWGVAPVRLTQMEPFCGRGFGNVDGRDWEESRALVRSSLRKGDALDKQPFEESVEEVFALLPQNGETVDLQPLVHKLFLDTTMKFLFGETSGALSSEPTPAMDSFLSSFNAGVRGCGLRIMLGPLQGLSSLTSFPRDCAVVARFVDTYVSRAVALRSSLSGAEKAEEESTTSHPLSRTLLYHIATTPAVDHTQIRSTITQAMMATLDTTSNLVSNTIFLLARDSTAYAALRSEVLAANAAAATDDRHVDYSSLPVMRATLHESLRLHPVFPAMNRVALRDTTLPRGGGSGGDEPVFVPQGTVVIAHWHAMHRTPAAWGGERSELASERASAVTSEERHASRDAGKHDARSHPSLPALDTFHPPRWAGLSISAPELPYMPFGAAAKRCLGQEKALREAAHVLARLAASFARIEARDDKAWRGRVTLAARNAGGCWVGLVPADEEENEMN